LVIVALCKNEGPYLDEWLHYHLLAGVEHFYLYDNGSLDNTLEVLAPYIEKGIVDLTIWPSATDDPNHVNAQIQAYKDGLKRAVGIATWVALIDLDEYILPIQHQTITECLNKNFKDVDAIYVNWRNFGTSYLTIPPGEPILNKMVLSSSMYHPRNVVGKSIVRPEKVDIDQIWYVHHCVLKRGAVYRDGNKKVMDSKNCDLKTDGLHHKDHLVIHHYGLRDEWYFHNIRKARFFKRFGSIDLLLEHYDAFNLTYNPQMLKYLKEKHPTEYDRYWGSR